MCNINNMREERPWGSFDILSDRDLYKVKQLTVLPGKRLSYQKHRLRREHWFIVEGIALVTLDGVEHVLTQHTSIDIPIGSFHRIFNPSSIQTLVMIEVQVGDYFGEDDIVRIEDDFGRVE